MRYSHDETLKRIKEYRLVAILRAVPMEKVEGVVSALIAGGVKVLEFTYDHGEQDYLDATTNKIRYACEHFGKDAVIGSGTTLTVEEVEATYAAGASLIITPNVNPDVIKRARALDMVAMPGALTPTEIELAWRNGADIVKVFPAGNLGPDYIKAVRGPLAHIPLSAVGGISVENVPAFLKAGVCGFGIGGPLVIPAAVKAGDYKAIEERARAFVEAIASWEAGK
ncbi:MAG: bifunctional 4-hydroxy-2-oxoglutarate aldolase/2-dehydro-3-deoxy-phosphogluconate aldolase [Clostridia bacterium]|nr:bifunctional 4-hydroxy-2-oxoglutarate aldolase/2-dehydro-3-deoxy-phosphogluconate aldolase [Clostridia bacterium]